MERVDYRVEDRVAILTIENPPVNALSAAVQTSLRDAVARAVNDSDADAAVITGAGNTFVAGADIRHLERMARDGVVQSTLPQILDEIEMAAKPFIAAIHGNTFGGGLEVALASHYRIATAGSKIGQPEVKIGIIPGAGGTQRLPRLAGVEAALEMCVFGEPVQAEQAQSLGIIDWIAEGGLLTSAIRFAREVSQVMPRRTRELTEKLGDRESNRALFAGFRERVRKTRRNLLAPEAAVEAIEAATTLPFEEGCRKEREIFKRLLVSSQAKALIHVFFAERAVGKPPGLDRNVDIAPIREAAVVGAGTMGRGIAMCFANAGIPVRIKEAKPEALDSALAAIRAIYQGSVKKGRITEEEMGHRLSSIRPQLDYEGFDTVDIVVEAAFENIDIKRALFAELDGLVSPNAILATNTSYLSIDEIAQACSRAERIIGLHFFSPANVMRLVEVVPGRNTAGNVTIAALSLATRLGKLPVVAGNCPGFIGNRILRVYRREAQLLLEEGALPRQVDSALEDWGMAMGPFAVQDLAGIDIAMSSREVFSPLDRAEVRSYRVMEMLYERGHLGQKTGSGWYRYDEKRNPQVDPEVEALIERAARQSGTIRRSVPNEEIIERTIYAIINEGARVLEEGYASTASDIDVVYIHGYGFPPYRGGPMHYADEVGLRVVCQRILKFNWEPTPLLARLAESNRSFSDLDNERLSLGAPADNTQTDHA